MKNAKRFLAVFLCLAVVLSFTPNVKPASAKAKFSVSKKAGTYTNVAETTVKATSGYKVYYKTSGKFKKANLIASGKSKSFAFTKTTTLSLIVLKSNKNVKMKKLNSSSYKSKIKSYKYTVKVKAAPSFTIKNGVLTGGNFDGFKTIVVPDGVTKIGKGAFEYNKNIEAVYLPDSLTEIAENAFNDCTGIEKIVIPKGVKKVGDYAFFQCVSLLQADFEPDEETYEPSVEYIGKGAFYGCESIENFNIPDTVTEVGEFALGACSSLTGVYIGKGIKEIPNQLCWRCSNIVTITIPENVKRIGSKAFMSNINMVELKFEGTLDEIDHEAFEGCSALPEITVDAIKIGEEAFADASGLEGIYLGENVETIEADAFDGVYSEVGNFYIPAKLKTLGDNAINSVKTSSYVVASSNPYFSTVDGVLFDKTKKTLVDYPSSKTDSSYSVPEGTEAIANCAFYQDYLKDVTMPNSVKTIGERAFSSCEDLENVTFSSSLNSIGECSFYATALKNIELPDSVTEIAGWAFASCRDLKTAVIGDGVTELKDFTFANDTSLSKVDVGSKVNAISSNTLAGAGIGFADVNLSGNANFKVQDGVLFSSDGKTLFAYPTIVKEEEYQDEEYIDPDAVGDSDVSSDASADAVAEEYIDSNEGDFYDPSSEEEYSNEPITVEYHVPDGVETIASGAFCGSLGEMNVDRLYVPASVKNIEWNAFGYEGIPSSYDERDKAYGNHDVYRATIIGEKGTAAEEYAKKNELAFFTGEFSANATSISMKMTDKKSFTISNSVKGTTLYFSNDPSIAKINVKTGAITPVAKGTTTLIAATGTLYITCELTVTNGSAPKANSYDTKYKEYGEKDLRSWIRSYMDYNNIKAIIKKHFPAIHEYTGSEYAYTVASFYGEDEYYFKKTMAPLNGDYGQYQKIAVNLGHELSMAEVPVDIKLFRGTGYITDITGTGGTLADAVGAIGKSYKSTSVSSTALLHSVATGFSGGDKGYVLEMYGDKGSVPGMYIASFSQYPHEAELLLTNGVTYKVVDAGIRMVDSEDYSSFERYIKLKIVG
ncbi:MAG: leucine-rich repeat protein [Lachnospiraceae bacterium]|nr:leucine-rich repeat protein [Lachnospiraceae bacterium]